MVALGGALALLAGCADFTQEAQAGAWSAQPTLSPEAPPNPGAPGQSDQNAGGSQGQQQNPTTVPPPKGCTDYNPVVIATCLNQVSAIAVLPGTADDPVGLAAERTTGRILRVHKGDKPAVVATLAVDAAGDGGLTGLALSPTYTQDQLVFAYVTTATDNRVMMIAPGDSPKPVLTGIPRGTKDNRGVLALDHKGALLVATGDAGNPSLASNPTSLAGKVLRIDANGEPAPGNPTPGSRVVASGLIDPGGMCTTADGARAWVTDRTPSQDVLYRVQSNHATLDTPAWTWPDKPGVAGCAAFDSSVMVATSTAGNLQNLSLNSDGSFTNKPVVTLQGKQGFGRLGGMDVLNTSAAMVGTVNKEPGGTPGSSDDRVVIITKQQAGGGQD